MVRTKADLLLLCWCWFYAAERLSGLEVAFDNLAPLNPRLWSRWGRPVVSNVRPWTLTEHTLTLVEAWRCPVASGGSSFSLDRCRRSRQRSTRTGDGFEALRGDSGAVGGSSASTLRSYGQT